MDDWSLIFAMGAVSVLGLTASFILLLSPV